jgi:hypothetical protein
VINLEMEREVNRAAVSKVSGMYDYTWVDQTGGPATERRSGARAAPSKNVIGYLRNNH